MIYKLLQKKYKNLPGRPLDYNLLLLAAIDILFLFFSNSYSVFLPKEINTFILLFDISTILIWGMDFLLRIRKEDTKQKKYRYLLTHWYEVAGLVPFQVLRPLLLLRGLKLAIAFYKFGKADEEISKALTREITFKFRDIIVDTIADAVFLQSLKRVEEVMVRLNYSELAREAFRKYEKDLNEAVKWSLQNKTTIGELSKLPFMGNIVHTASDDMSKIISEIMETEVFGNIMKEITKGILKEMYERVQKLDIERITRKETS